MLTKPIACSQFEKMSKLAEICEELDEVLIEVMATLDELSSLRAKYSEAISEVSSKWILKFDLSTFCTA